MLATFLFGAAAGGFGGYRLGASVTRWTMSRRLARQVFQR